MWRFILAWKCFFLVLFARRLPAEAYDLLPPPDLDPAKRLPFPEAELIGIESAKPPAQLQAPVTVPVAVPAPIVDAKAERERGAMLLLGVLQREGRLLDFLQENVDGVDDAQLGAGVREIHRGCKKALAEHLTIEPVMSEPDNATVTIANGFDASRIRLVGNVTGKPPFSGTLRHPGWRGADVKLPELATGHDPSVIAPAEVEL